MAGFLRIALTLLVAAAPTHAVPVGGTVLVDRPTGTGALPFDGATFSTVNAHALSGDGCFVVFDSRADALLTTDDNAAYNVYRLDRCSPGSPIVQVNTAADGTPAEGGSTSFDASISSDGRKVAFRSDSHVLDAAGTTNGRMQIFVKDLQTGALELVSRGTGASGAPVASNDVIRGVIAGGGSSVLFVAKGALDAENVDGVDGQTNLYLRDLFDDSTRMVSVTTSGGAGGGVDTQSFDVDQTGNRAVFVTSAQLDPVADTDNGFDAYVRFFIGSDVSGSTQLISPGTSAAGVAIASDSVYVAFTNFSHAFLTQCVFSCAAAMQIDQPKSGGSNATGGVNEVFFAPASGLSTARVYMRTSQALDPADTDAKLDLYGLDIGIPPNTGLHLETGAIDAAITAAAATDSGGVVTVNMEGSPHVLARTGGGFVPVSHASGEPARTNAAGSGFLRGSRTMSDDGRSVAFESEAPVFAGGFRGQVLVRDLASNVTTLASVAVDGTSPANNYVFLGGLDGAGRRVTFATGATNIVEGVADAKAHVFVRDLATGTTTLVDRSTGGGPSNDGAYEPRISGDGRRVVFTSSSTDLPGAPSNGKPHVYMADLVDGTSVLVDQTSNGIAGDDQAGGPDVDQTGRRVAFVSYADNLGASPNPSGSVFVRDVEDSTTTWVSRPEGGDAAQVSPFQETAISRDGTLVAFMQADPDFGFGATDDSQVFVHDLTDGSTTLASTGPLGAANEGVFDFGLSGDGKLVVFSTFSSNFAGSQPGLVEVFMRDLAAGTTSQVSLRDGATTGGRLGSSVPSLNLDGSCVAFESASDDMVADGYGPDYVHVFVHAISAACPPVATQPDAPPVVSDLRMERERFRATKVTGTAKQQAKRGTAFVFGLSEPADVAITIEREGRCRTARCRGVLSVASSAGSNRVPFGGRFGKKALKPGKYVATVVATDGAGQQSAPATVRFRVVR